MQWQPLKTLLSTVTNRYSEDKTLSIHFTQQLQIAAVTVRLSMMKPYIS
jgi:hypothetical protein